MIKTLLLLLGTSLFVFILGGVTSTNAATIQNSTTYQIIDHEFEVKAKFEGRQFLALGINDKGQIVGSFRDANNLPHGFLFYDNVLLDLGTFEGTFGHASAINDSGSITGWAKYGDVQKGFIYQNGETQIINGLSTITSFRGINDNNVIVGLHSRSGYKAITYKNGTITELTNLPLGQHTYANDINNNNQILGFTNNGGIITNFIYENENISILNVDFGLYSMVHGINDLGHIVGHSYTAPLSTPFIYKDEVITILPTLFEGSCEAQGINNRGQIVGFCTNGGNLHSVLWEPGEPEIFQDSFETQTK